MQQNTGDQLSQVEMEQCIQDCLNCQTVCVQTMEKYKQAGNQQDHAAYIRLLEDCAEICLTAAHFMQRNSPLYGYTCEACAQVCTRCAGASEQMGETDCANACTICAQSCQQIVKIVAF
jgi:hypothetical protein